MGDGQGVVGVLDRPQRREHGNASAASDHHQPRPPAASGATAAGRRGSDISGDAGEHEHEGQRPDAEPGRPTRRRAAGRRGRRRGRTGGRRTCTAWAAAAGDEEPALAVAGALAQDEHPDSGERTAISPLCRFGGVTRRGRSRRRPARRWRAPARGRHRGAGDRVPGPPPGPLPRRGAPGATAGAVETGADVGARSAVTARAPPRPATAGDRSALVMKPTAPLARHAPP